MDDILRDIGVLTGVFGAFVCDPAGNVLAAQPSTLRESPEYAEVARLAGRALTGLGALGHGLPGEIEMSFEKGRVIFRAAGPQANLGIVCLPSINSLMLKVQAAIAVKAVAARLASGSREAGKASANERVRKAVETVLGARAAKPLTLVAAAGESPEQLAAAGAEAVRFARLFLGKDEADELARRLRLVLGRRI